MTDTNDASDTTESEAPAPTEVDGTVEIVPGKHIIAALATDSDHAVFRWKLDRRYVVRVRKICGYGEDGKKLNAMIRAAQVGKRVHNHVPGRIGPREFSVVMTSEKAKSMSIVLDCTPETA